MTQRLMVTHSDIGLSFSRPWITVIFSDCSSWKLQTMAIGTDEYDAVNLIMKINMR